MRSAAKMVSLASRTARHTLAGGRGILATLTLAVPAEAQTNVVTAWNIVASSVTGNWRAPTIAHLAIHDALNATMRPFAMVSAAQSRPDAPPPLSEGRYARDYDEVRLIGALNSSRRTPDQTDAARYWAQLTQPAYNRITRAALEYHPLDMWEQARLFCGAPFFGAM